MFSIETTFYIHRQNLMIINPAISARTVVSRNGLLNAGAGYGNNRHEAERYAGYIADQMKIGDRVNLEIGFRVEHMRGAINRERTSTVLTRRITGRLTYNF